MSDSDRPDVPNDRFSEETNFELSEEYARIKNELLTRENNGNISKVELINYSPLRNDAGEVRSYLRDLSVALASQIEVVDTSDDKDDLKLESMSIITDESEPIKETSIVDEQPVIPTGSITDTVFSKLAPIRYNYKKRKLSSFIIKDNGAEEEQSVGMEPSLLLGDDSEIIHENNEDQEASLAMSPVISAIQEPEISFQEEPSMMHKMEQLEARSNAKLETNRERQPDHSIDMDTMSLDRREQHYLDTFSQHQREPLQLRDMIRPFLTEHNVKLTNESWKYLEMISEPFLEEISNELTDEFGKISLDRQSIIILLQKYKLVSQECTNDELFNLCTQYFPLEDINSIELALFE
ncbi:hypothetical protein Kpol_460p17 [Vanderwaltozyma polyspora DSM 70294]|uniref:Uncharacterized protein n=1 Tax=Vanderwaltozyma polyspora (strain ATCC 22028 / DSM 70294 / BCRC 21397 / CBS 2163 / NBRC 10782 / NRRL Y-8283 / UCD 57-17) TaxID=436907 RepID=A7TQT3_VANPO|nr:uncharacterized protein Kpol_460p17 [Vanderwaltozyma polyspora DSM 70294]EDO15382.1 hypothetical protein Kpol_460p17 [Vanderwaltozyma polyspora DSM 70294]